MQVTDLSELRPFFDTFRAESDRACGVLSGVLLDSLLESLLRKVMLPSIPNDIFKAQDILGSFSSKIDLAYYLGHISKGAFTELHLIRKIRNDFAHAINHSLTFSTSPVSDRVQHLQLPKLLLDCMHLMDKPLSESDLKAIREQPRKRFEISVGMVTGDLNERIMKAQTPTQLRGFADLFADLGSLSSGAA
jgi:hypothetical protein